jgi:PAS domain S-box-containing protein
MDNYEDVINKQGQLAREKIRALSEMGNLSERGTDLLRNLQADIARTDSLRRRLLTLSRAGKQEEARRLFRAESRAGAHDRDSLVAEFMRLQGEQLQQAEKAAAHRYERALARMCWITGATIAIAIVLSVAISHRIAKGVDRAKGVGNAVTKDLLKKNGLPVAPEGDEMNALGATLNHMRESLEQNLAEREHAEHALAAEKERATVTLRSIGDAVVASDPEGTILLLNEMAERLTGWSQEEAIGTPMAEVLHIVDEKSRKRCENPVQEVQDKGQIVGLANHPVLIARDGTERNIADSAAPIRGKSGNILGVVVVFRDITARRQAEQEIVRTSQRLKAALDAKSEFVSMVSHELRTPLTVVVGYAEMLLKSDRYPLPPSAAKPLQVILRRGKELQKLIEELLQLSSLDLRALAVETRPVPVQTEVTATIRDFQKIDFGKQVAMRWEGEEFEVLGDRAYFRRILENLINNAVKYSGESVEVVIRTRRKDGMGLVCVSDNGIGIDQEHLPRIFDRFYQGERVDTRAHGGAGLGLAIAKEMAELMGGALSVESQPGKGSAFTLSLPAADKANTVGGPVSADTHRAGQETSKDASRRVLVIDDDEDILELTSGMLADRFDVTGASSASRGRDLLQDSDFDVILLDWIMPGTDGLTFLRELKQSDATRDIPVVFISGKADQATIERGLQAGADDFVLKPFAKDDLLARVESLVPAARG